MSKPKRVLVRSVGATIRDSHGERAIVVWACGRDNGFGPRGGVRTRW